MKEEKRIYVVLPATVQVPTKTVIQPYGRQIAQACHVVSKLRFLDSKTTKFQPITTIILQARDSNEMVHNYIALRSKKLDPVLFQDENEAVYGKFRTVTALAVLATPKQVVGILDYLPLWGS